MPRRLLQADPLLTALALLVAALAQASTVAADTRPASELLLPYFEVHLAHGERTTAFAVGNAAAEPVSVRVTLHTNWGLPVLASTFPLGAGEVRSVNLHDWLVAGRLPERRVAATELAHAHAALTGQPSPLDGLLYGTPGDPFDSDLAVGYATLRIVHGLALPALWGDYFAIDPGEDQAGGDRLVAIDPSGGGALCDRHRLRFLAGGAFDGGTQVMVWSNRRLAPAPPGSAPKGARLLSASAFHRESGERFAEREIELLPVQVVDVEDLILAESFGWIDLVTAEDVWVGVRYSAEGRYSAGLETWCVENSVLAEVPGGAAVIDVEKAINGHDADTAPGPTVAAGAVALWTYTLTNRGQVPLADLAVEDDREGQVLCPKTSLAPGETMSCIRKGVALAGPYRGVATATAHPAGGGPEVRDSDPSHYRGVTGSLGLELEKSTNGEDADRAPGPTVAVGSRVEWSFRVTNSGDVTLVDVAVRDDREGAIPCPRTMLAPGETMTCLAAGSAFPGRYENLGLVDAAPVTGGAILSATDPSHYFGSEPPFRP